MNLKLKEVRKIDYYDKIKSITSDEYVPVYLILKKNDSGRFLYWRISDKDGLTEFKINSEGYVIEVSLISYQMGPPENLKSFEFANIKKVNGESILEVEKIYHKQEKDSFIVIDSNTKCYSWIEKRSMFIWSGNTLPTLMVSSDSISFYFDSKNQFIGCSILNLENNIIRNWNAKLDRTNRK